MKRETAERMARSALALYEKAHIALTEEEKAAVETADFGLDRPDEIGLQLVVYVNTERVCAKEMALLPGQTCPEHRHVPSYGKEGKEETFRCRWGTVYLYVDGAGDPAAIRARRPSSDVTVFREVVLTPGDQYTIRPGTKHWFQGGPEGAVVSEFSTHSTDETDEFTDPAVVREPKIEE